MEQANCTTQSHSPVSNSSIVLWRPHPAQSTEPNRHNFKSFLRETVLSLRMCLHPRKHHNRVKELKKELIALKTRNQCLQEQLENLKAFCDIQATRRERTIRRFIRQNHELFEGLLERHEVLLREFTVLNNEFVLLSNCARDLEEDYSVLERQNAALVSTNEELRSRNRSLEMQLEGLALQTQQAHETPLPSRSEGPKDTYPSSGCLDQ